MDQHHISLSADNTIVSRRYSAYIVQKAVAVVAINIHKISAAMESLSAYFDDDSDTSIDLKARAAVLQAYRDRWLKLSTMVSLTAHFINY
jgi:hypothetical protein